jgi:hypothetical protein
LQDFRQLADDMALRIQYHRAKAFGYTVGPILLGFLAQAN